MLPSCCDIACWPRQPVFLSRVAPLWGHGYHGGSTMSKTSAMATLSCTSRGRSPGKQAGGGPWGQALGVPLLSPCAARFPGGSATTEGAPIH